MAKFKKYKRKETFLYNLVSSLNELCKLFSFVVQEEINILASMPTGVQMVHLVQQCVTDCLIFLFSATYVLVMCFLTVSATS